MKNKLFITLLLPLVLVACTTEGGNKQSTSSSSIDNPIVSTNSSSLDKNSTPTPNLPKEELPSDAQEFVDAVNAIVLNYDSGKDINEAFVLYDNLVNWNYDEVLEAFDKLLLLEELYDDYLKLYNGVESFIARVDEIPYDLSINDERLITLAEDAYSKLNEEQKAMLGVSQAYNRLLDARSDFDALFAATIEEAKKEAAKGFTDLVDLIPEIDLLTLDNDDEINVAKEKYDTLSEEVKAMDEVIAAYETLEKAIARYNELLENPSINDEAIAKAFINAVSALPEIENVTLANRDEIFNANQIYKSLPSTTKASVSDEYSKLTKLIETYYDLYLESIGKSIDRDKVDNNVTLIRNAQDLLAIANNLSGSYKLANDIDVGGIEWMNLGNFTGTLDGAGHSIYNITNTIYSPETEDATFSLFRRMSSTAVVKNLMLDGTVTESDSWAGSIVVDNDGGRISNCLINLTISSSSSGHIGGIVCNNNAGGVIENCLVLSTINGGNWSGGIAVGQYATVNNTYFLSANVNTGAAVGNNYSALPNSGKTEAELKQASLYSSWDNSIWCIINGQYPTLVR